MMQTTHALTGMALAVPVAYQYPELGGFVLVAGLAGGAFPDFDLYNGHRRTLHYPVLYSVATVFAVLASILVPGPASIGATVFLAAAALHCLMDAFGGGLELRPWEGRSKRAVYDHVRRRWIPPRRWIRYDGAPEDLGLAAIASLPVLLVVDGLLAWVVIGMVTVSIVYATLRRQLPDMAMFLARRLPRFLHEFVPSRYLE